MKKSLFSLLLILSTFGIAQVPIGTGTAGAGSNSYPITAFFGFSYSQSIYLASEINASGNITSIQYVLNSGSDFSSSDEMIDVWIGHTTKASFDNNSDWVPIADLTQMFTNGTATIANDTLTITLASAFNYNGTDNLLIAVDANEAGFDGSSDYIRATAINGGANVTIHRQSDSANPDPAGTLPTGTLTSLRGNIILNGITVACSTPEAMTATGTTTNSTDLSWTAGTSGETAWNLEYHTANFLPGTSAAGISTASATGTPTSALTGLNSGTTYYVYYQADCSGGETSTWVGPFQFTTVCGIISTFPWTEDFEGASTPNLANCWDLINANNDIDSFSTYTTYGVGGSIAAGLNTDFNSGNNNDYLILPQFTLSGNQRLKFFTRVRSSGEPNDYRVVLSTTGTDTADFSTELLPLQTVSSTTQTEISPIDLSAYTGDVYIAIHVPDGGLDGWVIYFDDFTIEDIPTCQVPSAMTTSTMSTTTADLEWTVGGSAESAWNIEYHTADFTPGTSAAGIATTTASGTPATNLTGLTANTTYYVYYQADCSGGDFSAWVGPFEFTTECDAVSTFPWTEDFGSITTPDLPGCWDVLNINGDNDEFRTYPTYGVGGSVAAGLYTDFNSGNNNDYLILPKFTLTGNQRLRFFTRAHSSSEPNDYRVVLSTTGIDTADFSTELLALQTVSHTTQTEITPIDLSAYSGDVYIAIHVPDGGLDGWYIYFDDFTVEDIPTCQVPSAMTTANLSATTTDLNWTVGGSAEAAWNIEYHTADFTPGTSAAGIVTTNATGTPTTNLTGLTANTTYYVYYQADCTGGDYSAWVGPFEFTTSCEGVTVYPWTEDFNAVTTPSLPDCWRIINANGDNDEFQTYSSYGVSNSKSVGLYTDFNSGNNDDYLILPRFTLTGDKQLRFSVRARSSSEPNDYRVVISTTGTSPSDFSTELLPLQTVSSTTQTEINPIDLSAYSGDVYIAIHIPNGGLDGWFIYFDDFILDDQPCFVDRTNEYNGCIGDPYSITINSNIYNENNPTGIDTILMANGCDTVVTTNLVFAEPTTGFVSETSCESSIEVNGETYTTSGTYTQTITNVAGCDSVLSVNITVQQDVDPEIQLVNGVFVSNQVIGTYEWFVCGSTTPIPGETNNMYTPTSNGEYYMTVSLNGCTYETECLEINTIGVNEFDSSISFEVYPNPNNGNFNVSWSSNDILELQVVNALGMSIYSTSIEENTFEKEINVQVEQGIYYIQLLTSDNTWNTKKLIIK
ncbi:MAG: choice-of-anchor J domain-containing protein [Flavobacteriales bacterium]